jgi:hypothetical protein
MKTSELKSEIKDYIYEILSEGAAEDAKAEQDQIKAIRTQIDALRTQLTSLNNPNTQISSGNPTKDTQVITAKKTAINSQIKALNSRLQALTKPGTQSQALTEEEETLDEAKKDKIKEVIKKIKMMEEGDDKKQKVAALKNIVDKLKK